MAVASPAVVGRSTSGSPRALRVGYAASVVLLVVLALATLASPLLLPGLRRDEAALSEAGRLQVLAKADEWVLEYHLTNGNDRDETYTFEIALAEPTSPARNAYVAGRSVHTTSVLVGAGRTYGFIYHLRPSETQGAPIRFLLHRGGDAAPIEDVTLHLASLESTR